MLKPVDYPNRLRALRTAAGLSRVRLAREIDVDPSTIWAWELGRNSLPDKHKTTLAIFFGVSRAHLMGWDEVDGPPADRTEAA